MKRIWISLIFIIGPLSVWGQLPDWQWHHLIPNSPNHYYRGLPKYKTGSSEVFTQHHAKHGLLLRVSDHRLTINSWHEGGGGQNVPVGQIYPAIQSSWHIDYNDTVIGIMIATIMRARTLGYPTAVQGGGSASAHTYPTPVAAGQVRYQKGSKVDWDSYFKDWHKFYTLDIDPASDAGATFQAKRRIFVGEYLLACGGVDLHPLHEGPSHPLAGKSLADLGYVQGRAKEIYLSINFRGNQWGPQKVGKVELELFDRGNNEIVPRIKTASMYIEHYNDLTEMAWKLCANASPSYVRINQAGIPADMPYTTVSVR